jgi:hypothetical protein
MARLEEWLPRASCLRALRVHRIRLIGLLCHLTKNAGVFWDAGIFYWCVLGFDAGRGRGFRIRRGIGLDWSRQVLRAQWVRLSWRGSGGGAQLAGLSCHAQFATISNECVNSAVLAIMIDAEQYLSCERLIARSTVAGFRFLPVTVK